MNFTKTDPADLNFPRRELFNGGGSLAKYFFVCVCRGPIQLYRVSPTKLSEIKV